MSSEELRWLESISALHKKVDDAVARVGPDYEQSEVASIADTLRSCSRDLAAPGSPSARLQSAYELVKQACQEYDKGAECLATAVKVWNQPGAANEQTVGDSLSCGQTAHTTGSKLLTDAEVMGLKEAATR
jgi:hypothetical protein